MFADFGSTDSNGSTGTATVDLRGLGAARTLVLVDGKRLMPGDPAYPVADLNNIPAALVDHVEVLTGGASAVYGSDAEAGVVNFIMRKDFEGVEIDGQYSIHNASNGHGELEALQQPNFPTAPKDWWGGSTADLTLLVGTNTADGKGNITAYLNYRNVQPVLQSKRDFSACSLFAYHSTIYCAGSSNKNRWFSWDNLYSGVPFDFYETGTGADRHRLVRALLGGPAVFGNALQLRAAELRPAPGRPVYRRVLRPLSGVKAFDVYSNFMFTDDHTLAQIAPSAAFLSSGPTNFPGTQSPGFVQVNCSNPLMTCAGKRGPVPLQRNPYQLSGTGRRSRPCSLPYRPGLSGRRLVGWRSQLHSRPVPAVPGPPQHRGRQSYRRSAAHLVPHGRRHQGRSGRRLVV